MGNKQGRRRETARLVAVEGKSVREAAEAQGVTRRCASRWWAEARESAALDLVDPAEREALCFHIAASVKKMFTDAAARAGESASFGILALRAGENLMKIYGIDRNFIQALGQGDGVGVVGLFDHLHVQSPVFGAKTAAMVEAIKARNFPT